MGARSDPERPLPAERPVPPLPSQLVIIETAPVWLAATNAWVLARERGGPALIVDAPPNDDGLASLLARHDLYPAALVVTHGHIDHCGGAGTVVRRHDIRAFVHPADDFLTLHPAEQLRRLFGTAIPGDFEPPDRYETLEPGKVLDLAGFSIEVRHTPGHTPGHCCFLLAADGVLFSGDQLFAGSIGRTDLPGGSLPRLLESMATQVLVLDDDVDVHPGHGPSTTIGRERASNPFLLGL